MNRHTYGCVAFIAAATRKGHSTGGNQSLVYSAQEIAVEARNLLMADWADVGDAAGSAIAETLVAEAFADAIETPHASARYRFNMFRADDYVPSDDSGDNDLQRTLRLHSELGDSWLRESFSNVSKDRSLETSTDARLPASDRYVTLADNQSADVKAELEDLAAAIHESNEGTEEDRLIALSEIASFEQTIVQPRVSVDLIERFTNKIIAWITRTFSAALVADVAARLVAKLLSLVS